jgi:hypothetical protein
MNSRSLPEKRGYYWNGNVMFKYKQVEVQQLVSITDTNKMKINHTTITQPIRLEESTEVELENCTIKCNS